MTLTHLQCMLSCCDLCMEYNREDKKKGENIKNLQITSLGVAPMDENVLNEEVKTGKLDFNCGTPSLKTLGEVVFNSEKEKKKVLFSREEDSAFDCGDQFHDLLRSRFGFLLHGLSIGNTDLGW